MIQGVADMFGLRMALNNTDIINVKPGAISVFGLGTGGALAADFAAFSQMMTSDGKTHFATPAVSVASAPASIVADVLDSPTLMMSQGKTVVASSTTYAQWADKGGEGDCKWLAEDREKRRDNNETTNLSDDPVGPGDDPAEPSGNIKKLLGAAINLLGTVVRVESCLARYKLAHPQEFANDVRRFTVKAQTAYTKVDPANLMGKIPEQQNLLVLINKHNYRYPVTAGDGSLAGIKNVVEANSIKTLKRTEKCRASTCTNQKAAYYRMGGNFTIIDTLSNLILGSPDIGPLRWTRDAMTTQNSSFLISIGREIKVKQTDKLWMQRW